MKRVLYYQPFIAEIEGEKKVRARRPPQAPNRADPGARCGQMMNMTVYEDSDPANLAIEAGKNYGLPANQQGQLKVAIESQILQRVKLRIPIDMSGNGTSHSPPSLQLAAHPPPCSALTLLAWHSGIGKQLLVVQQSDDAVSAVKRFAEEMKNMGITLSDSGLQSIAQGVQKQLLAKAQNAAAEQAAAIEEQKK